MSFSSKLIYMLLFLSILLTILVYKAYVINQPCKHKLIPVNDLNRIKLDDDMVKRLQKSLRIQTISYDFQNQNTKALEEHGKFIRDEFNELEKYPFVTFEYVNKYSMLYKIQGTEKNLKPYLLAAHIDVVPAKLEDGKWTHEPFSAEIENGHIYARGSMDDKANMLGQLEAIRFYLKKFGQPKRTIYLAYGHDEEASGLDGANNMAKLLANVSLEYVLDEGSMVIEDIFPDIEKPISYISVADKGYLTIKFFVNVTGGHSSMPNADESAIFILADAISKLKTKKLPSQLGNGPEVRILEELALNFDFFKRVAMSNVWFFNPILKYILSLKPATDAMQRTTTAVTIFNSGMKDNVLPPYAEFVVNHRIHSSQSCDEILELDLKIMQDDRINYEVLSCVEPSHLSPSDSLGYSLIKHTTKQIYPESIPIPGVMLGLTDSRYYAGSTKNIYKFTPIRVKNSDMKRFHGADERISIENFENLINFYFFLIDNTDKAHLNVKDEAHSEL